MNTLKSLLSFKTVYSDNKTYLVFSVGKKEAINYSQVQTLESDVYRDYFLPFQCTKTTRTNKIGYDISGLTSLSEYLKTEMRQDQYFEIISGIQKIISFCQRAHFSTDNLVCDPKYMYYHNVSKKIMMIYLPLNNQHYVCDDITACLCKIHKSARNVIITDGNYMNNYEKFLNGFQIASRKHSQNYFNPDSLLHFFKSNHMTSLDEDVEEYTVEKEPEKSRSIGYPINEQIAGSDSCASGKSEENNVSCNTLIRGKKPEAFLIDENGNRFDIGKYPFSIGRNQKKDLIIDEPTVSGNHAVITEKDGKFFINDSSSNGTFLNDENNRIKSEEIKNGDKLFFDHFCYIFYIARNDGSEDERASKTVVVSRVPDGGKNAYEK